MVGGVIQGGEGRQGYLWLAWLARRVWQVGRSLEGRGLLEEEGEVMVMSEVSRRGSICVLLKHNVPSRQVFNAIRYVKS